MANKTLFASLQDALIPQTDTVNSENAPAYALVPKQALAQYAATNCFGRTFYAAADEQLTRVLELCDAVDSEFVARVAIYSRTQSFMKDMPALLWAWLSTRAPRLHAAVFARVIDNARMLRTYVRFFVPAWLAFRAVCEDAGSKSPPILREKSAISFSVSSERSILRHIMSPFLGTNIVD